MQVQLQLDNFPCFFILHVFNAVYIYLKNYAVRYNVWMNKGQQLMISHYRLIWQFLFFFKL